MPRYCFGPFELDSEARLLRREGEAVPLAGKTFDALLVLVERRGRLVDKEELLSRVWAGSVVEEAAVTQTVFTVRKILGDSPRDHRYIATVAGRGYQFVAPVTEAPKRAEAGDKDQPEPRKELQPFWRRSHVLQAGGAGLGVAVLVTGVALWRAQQPGQIPEKLQISRFTSYPGVETMPAFSPDGKQIAYVRAEHDPFG